MIARLWRGRVATSDADDYVRYLQRTGIPDYEATPGNRGVRLLRRTVGNETYFLLLTFWDSYDAIRAFAGDDIERARYYPRDEAYLIDPEETVLHFDVVPDRAQGDGAR